MRCHVFIAGFFSFLFLFPSASRAEGLEQLRAQAGKGDVSAQYELARAYANGTGTQRDMDLAVSWFAKATRGGNPDAPLALGRIFANGDGVTRNFVRAKEFFRIAAERGNAGAMFRLGLMAERGDGGPQDIKMAFGWYERAVGEGNREAKSALERLRRKYPILAATEMSNSLAQPPSNESVPLEPSPTLAAQVSAAVPREQGLTAPATAFSAPPLGSPKIEAFSSSLAVSESVPLEPSPTLVAQVSAAVPREQGPTAPATAFSVPSFGAPKIETFSSSRAVTDRYSQGPRPRAANKFSKSAVSTSHSPVSPQSGAVEKNELEFALQVLLIYLGIIFLLATDDFVIVYENANDFISSCAVLFCVLGAMISGVEHVYLLMWAFIAVVAYLGFRASAVAIRSNGWIVGLLVIPAKLLFSSAIPFLALQHLSTKEGKTRDKWKYSPLVVLVILAMISFVLTNGERVKAKRHPLAPIPRANA